MAKSLQSAMHSSAELILLGETVGRSGGIQGSTKGLLDTFGTERVIDTPISDRASLAMAVGLALAGKTCVVELSGSGRIPALFEVLTHAVLVAQRKEFTLNLVVRIPCGGQAGDRIDRSSSELLATLDGCQVLCPSDGNGLLNGLQTALDYAGVSILLEPRTLYSQRVDAKPTQQDMRKAHALRTGDHITLVSWGTGVAAAQRAADQLAEENISAAVVSLNQLNPIDADTLGEWIRHTGRAICVEAPEGGLASRVLNTSLSSAFLFLEAPLTASSASESEVVQAAREAVFY
jgi:pyruvate dehydrogenase E1 component beta subunit